MCQEKSTSWTLRALLKSTKKRLLDCRVDQKYSLYRILFHCLFLKVFCYPLVYLFSHRTTCYSGIICTLRSWPIWINHPSNIMSPFQYIFCGSRVLILWYPLVHYSQFCSFFLNILTFFSAPCSSTFYCNSPSPQILKQKVQNNNWFPRERTHLQK